MAEVRRRAGRPLRVCVLSDGQPGHYNQSRGIVRALQHVRPVEASWLEVRLRIGLARSLLRWRLNRKPRPVTTRLLRAACRIDSLPPPGCDVIVSAGGKTSFANAWLAAVLGIPNVYAGSLRGLDPALFSLVLTLEPIAGAAGNLVLPLPPSPVTPQEVADHGQALRQQLGAGAQRYWTLMVGGDGAGFRYGSDDWAQLPRLMRDLAARHGIRWLVASSRRTGRDAERRLRAELDHEFVADACWFGDDDACDTAAYLGAAEQVFVTEDSMTMLTEAICSMRPVRSLRPAQASPDSRYAQAVMRFEEQGLICRHSLAGLAQHPESLQGSQCRVLDQSPLEQLGARLAERLGLS